jgi:hypothetical protein
MDARLSGHLVLISPEVEFSEVSRTEKTFLMTVFFARENLLLITGLSI